MPSGEPGTGAATRYRGLPLRVLPEPEAEAGAEAGAEGRAR